MRVTFLLVAFLAGAHSFKAVERRAVLMGKGGGGETARSVAEDAIQAHGLDDNVAVAHKINTIRATLGAPACNPYTYYSGSGSFDTDVNGHLVVGVPGPGPRVPASKGSLLPHVVPRRHGLAARLRDLGEIWTPLQDGPEAAVDVVPGLRRAKTWPLRESTSESSGAPSSPRGLQANFFAASRFTPVLSQAFESCCSRSVNGEGR